MFFVNWKKVVLYKIANEGPKEFLAHQMDAIFFMMTLHRLHIVLF